MAWRKPRNLREWIKLVVRHRKKAFFPAVLAAIGVTIGSFWIEREYRAEAKFQRSMDLVAVELNNRTLRRNLSTARYQMHESIRGRDAVSDLIDDLIASDPYVSKLWQFPHVPDGSLTQEGEFKKQDLIRKVQRSLSVRYQIQSENLDLVSVSFTDKDRELPPKVANRVVENYIKNTRDQLNGLLMNAQRFFKNEADRATALVQEYEQKKLRFELDHPGIMPNDPHNVRDALVALKAKRDALTENIHVLTHRRQALLDFIKNQPEMIVKEVMEQNPDYARVANQLTRYRNDLEYSKTELRRTEQHPDVIKARERIAELEKELAEIDKDIRREQEAEPNMQRLEGQQKAVELQAELVAYEKRRNELNNRIEQYELMDRNFFQVRNDYQKITSTLSDARRALRLWEGKLRTTTTALTTEIGYRGVHLNFYQHAPDLARPSKPTLIQIAGMVLAAGAGLAAVMIMLAELLDNSFRSVEQAVDDLKLPVLGAVNEIVTPGRAMRRRLVGWGVVPSVIAVMAVVLGVSFLSVYVSLQYPHRFDQFKSNPISFVQRTFLN